jgi:hypothetical protein
LIRFGLIRFGLISLDSIQFSLFNLAWQVFQKNPSWSSLANLSVSVSFFCEFQLKPVSQHAENPSPGFCAEVWRAVCGEYRTLPGQNSKFSNYDTQFTEMRTFQKTKTPSSLCGTEVGDGLGFLNASALSV